MGLLGGLLALITLSGVKRLNRAFVFLTNQGKQGTTQELTTTSDEDDDWASLHIQVYSKSSQLDSDSLQCLIAE